MKLTSWLSGATQENEWLPCQQSPLCWAVCDVPCADRGGSRQARMSGQLALTACHYQAAAAAGYRSCRPEGAGRASSSQPAAEPARPSEARSSMCMASRMAPSISRSHSAGVMSPRSARSRKVAQVCSSAASTVSMVITVPTSTPQAYPQWCRAGAGALVPLWGPRHPRRSNDRQRPDRQERSWASGTRRSAARCGLSIRHA